jgi:hypothetical protein
MVSMKLEEAVSANGIVDSYTDMMGIDAKGNNDWIKAGSGDDQAIPAPLRRWPTRWPRER